MHFPKTHVICSNSNDRMSYYVGHEATRGITVSPLNGIVHRWLIQTLFFQVTQLIGIYLQFVFILLNGERCCGTETQELKKASPARPGTHNC